MKSIGTRVLSVAVAIPVVVAAVLLGPAALFVLLTFLYVLSWREIASLTEALGGKPFVLFAAAGLAFLVLGLWGYPHSFLPMTVIVLLLAAAITMVTGEAVGAALGFFLTLWVAWPLGLLAALSHFGALVVLATLAVVWADDVAAYLVGSAIGRHPFAPLVSPGKTWEGSVAGLLVAVLVAMLLHGWFGLTLGDGAFLGVVTGIFAQAGDLFESSLKRKAELKDSGAFLPGHGGVLDRLDAVLFGVIAVYYFLTLRGHL